MMAVPTCSDIKKDYSRFFAEYLKDAHDFALLSEEEAHVLLTKGHLGRERFNGELYASTSIDFAPRINLQNPSQLIATFFVEPKGPLGLTLNFFTM